MPEFTTNEWIILLLVLVLGWLLGMLSASTGGRWRREREARHADETHAAERERHRPR